MKSLFKRLCFSGLCCVLPLFFVLGCSSDSGDSKNDDGSFISSVEIQVDTTTISASGSLEMTAKTETVGSPSLTYSWTVVSGNAYASISNGTSAKAKLNGTNDTNSDQSVEVKVVVSDGTNKKENTKSFTVSAKPSDTKAISSVTISPSSAQISTYNGTSTLTANVTATGNPTLKYWWEITSGDSYAYFGTEGTKTKETNTNTVTLTANNTMQSEQTVKITVTATDTSDSTVTKTSSAATIKIAANASDDNTNDDGGDDNTDSSSKGTVSLTFLNGDKDLTVECKTTGTAYTFTATPPDSQDSYEYEWFIGDAKQSGTSATLTVASSEVSDGSVIWVTAKEKSTLVIYSASYSL